jgi:hypothetical protein
MTEKPGASPADPHELADQREREADEMERRSQELESQASDARDDWARKRADPSVPGAPEPDDASAAGSGTKTD